MLSSIDKASGASLWSLVWRPAGLWHIIACLAGLAAGLRPDAIVSSQHLPGGAPLPALQCVGVFQAGFILLIYPLVMMRRSLRRGEELRPLAAALEAAACMITAVPFYVAAAYLSDAVAADAVRLALQLILLWPAAWVAGVYLARGPVRPAALLALLLIVLALPAAYYVAADFLPLRAPAWLWHMGPVTFAWTTAASRQAALTPEPVWAWLIWAGVALAAGLLRLLLPEARTHHAQGP